MIDFLKGRFSKEQSKNGSDADSPSPSRVSGGPSVQIQNSVVVDEKHDPLLIDRKGHSISRGMMDPDALKVMYRLLNHGFKAYLVGGGVRDLLLGKTPKDYDIGTDARPEQVRKLFRNSRIIGRRFRLNHIYFHGNKIFEIATFRALSEEEEESSEDQLIVTSDNIYGDPQSDALRRDLTINGLFYDLSTYSVIDYVGGMSDLRNGIIRMIGEPEKRFREDPVRMIRAIRHAARTGFRIDEHTYNAIKKCAPLIELSSKARVYEEFLREFRGGCAEQSLSMLHETGLLGYLLPFIEKSFSEKDKPALQSLQFALRSVDAAIKSGREIEAGVLFAAMLIGHHFPKGEKVFHAPPVLEAVSEEVAEEAVEEVTEEQEGEAPQREIEIDRYFEVSPVFEETDFAGGDLFPKLPSGTQRRSRRREKVAPKSKLRTLINELFAVFGLPKKQREIMEYVLIGRYMLFCAMKEEHLISTIFDKSYFDDILLLLRLTAADQPAKKCLFFWEELLDQQNSIQSGETHDRYRPRRRRRGRRRPRS